jgi:hypothetical protein
VDDRRILTWNQAQATIAGLAALAGLGVYVYLLGGIVAWLRAVAARLPADNVTPAFENRHLIALGLKVVALEVLLLLVVAAVIFAVLGVIKETERTAKHRGGPKDAQQHFSRPEGDDDGEDLPLALSIAFRSLLIGLLLAALGSTTDTLTEGKWLGLAILIAATVAAIELTLRWRTTLLVPIALRPPSGHRFAAECLSRLAVWTLVAETVYLGLWKLAAPLGAAVLVLLALLAVVHYARSLQLWTGVAVVMVALNLTIVPYLATPPVAYERATIITTSGAMRQGAYLGRTSEGVYLGTCEPFSPGSDGSKLARVEVVAPEEIAELTLGGPRYVFDVARRPTLYALTNHFLTGDDLRPSDDGVQLDLRHRRETCLRYTAH